MYTQKTHQLASFKAHIHLLDNVMHHHHVIINIWETLPTPHIKIHQPGLTQTGCAYVGDIIQGINDLTTLSTEKGWKNYHSLLDDLFSASSHSFSAFSGESATYTVSLLLLFMKSTSFSGVLSKVKGFFKLNATARLTIKRALVCGISLFIALFNPAFGIMIACTYFLMYDKWYLRQV